MQIIPAIDIKNRKCVRLYKGNFGREIIYGDNPVDMALKWKNQGAKMIHVVDLDGARIGQPAIMDIIKQIINKAGIPVRAGGGIRDLVSIYRYIDTGVSAIILGTVALEDGVLLKKAIDTYGEKIIVSLDVKNKKLMKRGWLRKSNFRLIPTIIKLEKIGVKTIIYTDTVRDGTLTGPNYKDIALIKKNTGMNLIAAGGISSVDQIIKLKKMGVSAIILGKALYANKINLKEVINYVN